MPERSNLEDKALAVGLIAVGAALPIYEIVSGRLREFGHTPAGKALRVTADTTYSVTNAALRGAQRLLDRNTQPDGEPASKTKAA